ncbi:hypothetical protein Q1695_013711 [Nippostrongylus brasiliensis]|nr:hypothetical protein Q1695_013711 [Nippostrongylus brasiliensis]
MQTYAAEIGEMVRAQRRDEEEVDALHERISWVVKELMGQRTWMKLYPYLRTVALTAYYSCTTLSGVQTLGEEYLRIFQIQSAGRVAPTFSSRIVFVLTHTVAPLLAQFALQRADRLLAHPSTSRFLGIPIRSNPKARRSFKSLIDWISSVGVPHLYRLHLAVFYIFGSYYYISRRITGIRYLSLSPQTDLKFSFALKVYRFLGYLTLIQTTLSLILWILSEVEAERQRKIAKLETKTTEEDVTLDDNFHHSWFRCSVCLESKSPSTTTCGHLFCWRCIQAS